MRRKLLMFVTALLLAIPALAGNNGTYKLAGGAYTIDVEFADDALKVVEPNKVSVYQRQADGSYHFSNPTNGVVYGMRVIDDQTLEAFKPGSNSAPSTLKLQVAPAFEDNADSERHMETAMKYQQMAISDNDNAHVWSVCGMSAMAMATLTQADAARQINEAVAMIKPIMVNQGNPCPDAIPGGHW